MKKILLYILLPFFIGCLFFGCDIIAEDDRLIEVEVDIKKNVLLVEFTDQSCVNCPNAAKEIEKLKDRYNDTLVAVSMHASSRSYSLVTEDGNNYERYFETNKTGHPVAVIDGGRPSTDIAGWGGMVIQQLANESPVVIELVPSYNAENRELTINTTLAGLKDANFNFQLWLTEDGIVDYQKVSATEEDPNYVHNHVFRAAVNGTWGEGITLAEGEQKELSHKITLYEGTQVGEEKVGGWKPEHIHIIGFVFNNSTKEVYQAVEIKL